MIHTQPEAPEGRLRCLLQIFYAMNVGVKNSMNKQEQCDY